MSPNPTVERGLYSPTKQPRALDLGDVGKEVEKLKKFIRIQKTRIPMFRCSVINCQKIGLKSKSSSSCCSNIEHLKIYFKMYFFSLIFSVLKEILFVWRQFCKSSKHHIIIKVLIFWEERRIQNQLNLVAYQVDIMLVRLLNFLSLTSIKRWLVNRFFQKLFCNDVE